MLDIEIDLNRYEQIQEMFIYLSSLNKGFDIDYHGVLQEHRLYLDNQIVAVLLKTKTKYYYKDIKEF